MKRIVAIIICIALLLLFGCSDQTSNSESSQSSFKPAEDIKWNETISLPFPPPQANEYIMHDTGQIDCSGVERKGLEDYLEVLKNDGWNTVNGTSIVLTKGNDFIDILDQTFITSTPSNNNLIRITYLPGYHGDYKGGRITPDRARPLIQDYLNNLPQNHHGYRRQIKSIGELDLGDAYQKMGLQGFRAYSDENSSAYSVNGAGNFCATYIIGKNNALSQILAQEFCIADIDNDGEYEFITIIGYGSGIFRIVINAYKYDSNEKNLEIAYSNRWIPKEGYAELTIVKVNDNTVNLCSAEMKKGKLIPKENYGALKISGNRLVPQNDEMPFEQWGN